ncbi:MAG: polysaccharide biosynthesis protein, partial [Anaerolineae bacterium]
MIHAYIISILKPFHRLRRLVGIDKAVFYSILSRAFSTAGSLISVPLILTRLTAVEQGFYYTFGSILALQVFLELGFGAVAIQMVAHEAAHLKVDLASELSGPEIYLDRISATIRFIRKWYIVLSFLVGALLLPAGFWFFRTSASYTSVTWLGPWMIMIFTAAGGVFVNSLGSIIEGLGLVAESILVRLWGGAAQILLTIAGLLVGLRLYAVPLASFVALIINFSLIWRLLHNVIRQTRSYGKENRIDWLKEVLPFQWRVALSWLSGWFIFSAMIPVVFRQFGPVEAGRFGLAMSISGFISAFTTSWSSTKAAIWGQMVSRKDWKSMDSLFWRVMPQAVGIAALASAFAILIVPRLSLWIPRFSGRLPD